MFLSDLTWARVAALDKCFQRRVHTASNIMGKWLEVRWYTYEKHLAQVGKKVNIFCPHLINSQSDVWVRFPKDFFSHGEH